MQKYAADKHAVPFRGNTGRAGQGRAGQGRAGQGKVQHGRLTRCPKA